jgi:hypothetical protein
MHLLDAIQWPAMVVTVIAAWMFASQRKFKRNWGFWLFIVSNGLWILWGLRDGAHALIFLQLCLAFLNIRGSYEESFNGNWNSYVVLRSPQLGRLKPTEDTLRLSGF